MRSKIRLRSPRERGLAVLGASFSRRLARSGRRDGRRGIPVSGDADMASPTQAELKSVAALSVHAVGADLFNELPPHDKRVAAARRRTRPAAEAHDRAVRDEREATEAARATPAGGVTATSADTSAQRHRRARALAVAAQAAHGRLDEARTELMELTGEAHETTCSGQAPRRPHATRMHDQGVATALLTPKSSQDDRAGFLDARNVAAMWRDRMDDPRFEPVYRTILAFDIEGFGGPQRSNPIRSMMRMALYALIRESLAGAIGSLSQCSLSDLGDGALVLITAEVPKNRVVEPLMADMAAGLKRYNDQAGPSAEIRLRAVLHAGDIVEDPQGYSGEDLNLAFRLLDCAELRAALSRSRADLGLVVSDAFYNAIVKQGFEGIDPAQYTEVDVKVKETHAKAWIHLPIPRFEAEPPRDSPDPRTVGHPRPTAVLPVQKPVDLRDLPPTCLYVSTGDVHNHRLYSLHAGNVPLRNHLETALLLGRHAVLHSLDLYRSDEVALLVAEFEEFVKDGSLLLLLTERVARPRRDYAAYLQHRAREYGRSPYGELDVESFRVPDPTSAIERAVRFLEMSPFTLHRGYSATKAFTRAVREDMDVDERIVVGDHYSASRIRELSLSLRQILQLARLEPDGSQRPLLADDVTIGHLQDKIADLVTHEFFSKQILIGMIQEELGLEDSDPFYEVIAARIGVVHLVATVGNVSFLEITHSRDQLSPYYYQHLLDHLGVLVDCPPKQELGVDLVDELRSLRWWRFFANYHLRLMADLQARQASGDLDPDPLLMFEGSSLITQFDDIRAVLRNAWEA